MMKTNNTEMCGGFDCPAGPLVLDPNSARALDRAEVLQGEIAYRHRQDDLSNNEGSNVAELSVRAQGQYGGRGLLR